MTNRVLTAAAQVFAEDTGAILWDGVPSGGPRVRWIDADVSSYFDKLRPLAPTIVYLSPDRDLIAVAIAGVVHVFDPDRHRFGPGGPGVLQIVDDTVDDEDVELSPALVDLAKRIAADERFEGYGGHIAQDLIDESELNVDPGLYFHIEFEAQRIFEKAIGAQLEKESRDIVRELIKHPDFDPLLDRFWKDEGYPYIDQAVAGRDSRLTRMVRRGLQEAVSERGLGEKAEREMKDEATRLRGTIPRLVLDQVGFALRRGTRNVLLAPFLDSVAERRREITGDWIHGLEGDRAQVKREERYAVAAQRLWVGTATKTAIAAQLQITTTTLNRLLGARVPADFEFESNDPIVLELAPELRR